MSKNPSNLESLKKKENELFSEIDFELCEHLVNFLLMINTNKMILSQEYDEKKHLLFSDFYCINCKGFFDSLNKKNHDFHETIKKDKDLNNTFFVSEVFERIEKKFFTDISEEEYNLLNLETDFNSEIEKSIQNVHLLLMKLKDRKIMEFNDFKKEYETNFKKIKKDFFDLKFKFSKFYLKNEAYFFSKKTISNLNKDKSDHTISDIIYLINLDLHNKIQKAEKNFEEYINTEKNRVFGHKQDLHKILKKFNSQIQSLIDSHIKTTTIENVFPYFTQELDLSLKNFSQVFEDLNKTYVNIKDPNFTIKFDNYLNDFENDIFFKYFAKLSEFKDNPNKKFSKTLDCHQVGSDLKFNIITKDEINESSNLKNFSNLNQRFSIQVDQNKTKFYFENFLKKSLENKNTDQNYLQEEKDYSPVKDKGIRVSVNLPYHNNPEKIKELDYNLLKRNTNNMSRTNIKRNELINDRICKIVGIEDSRNEDANKNLIKNKSKSFLINDNNKSSKKNDKIFHVNNFLKEEIIDRNDNKNDIFIQDPNSKKIKRGSEYKNNSFVNNSNIRNDSIDNKKKTRYNREFIKNNIEIEGNYKKSQTRKFSRSKSLINSSHYFDNTINTPNQSLSRKISFNDSIKNSKFRSKSVIESDFIHHKKSSKILKNKSNSFLNSELNNSVLNKNNNFKKILNNQNNSNSQHSDNFDEIQTYNKIDNKRSVSQINLNFSNANFMENKSNKLLKKDLQTPIYNGTKENDNLKFRYILNVCNKKFKNSLNDNSKKKKTNRNNYSKIKEAKEYQNVNLNRTNSIIFKIPGKYEKKNFKSIQVISPPEIINVFRELINSKELNEKKIFKDKEYLEKIKKSIEYKYFLLKKFFILSLLDKFGDYNDKNSIDNHSNKKPGIKINEKNLCISNDTQYNFIFNENHLENLTNLIIPKIKILTNEIIIFNRKNNSIFKHIVPLNFEEHGIDYFLDGCRYIVANEKIYISGGRNQEKYFSIYLEYDYINNNIKKLKDLCFARAYHKMHYCHNKQRIYFLGGENNKSSEFYDFYNCVNIPMPNLNEGRCYLNSYLSCDGSRLYALFGIKGKIQVGEFSDKVEVINLDELESSLKHLVNGNNDENIFNYISMKKNKYNYNNTININNIEEEINKISCETLYKTKWEFLDYKNLGDIDLKFRYVGVYPLERDILLLIGGCLYREINLIITVYNLKKNEITKVDDNILNEIMKRSKDDTVLMKILAEINKKIYK